MKKRFLSIALALCMMLTLLPTVALADTLPQAQWGLAGIGGTAPTSWVNSGTLVDAMSYANGLGSGTAYIQLLTNINKDNHTSWPLTFVWGKTTVLDLNGKDIDRGLTVASGSGHVINANGVLTLKDSSTGTVADQGKITGGFNSDTRGGCVSVYGSFTMEGGRITGNKSTDESNGGGGVINRGNFTMTGGSIEGNEAKYWGGGIYSAGDTTLTGGSITGNSSVNGGVHAGDSFTVGGTAVIKDNWTTDATPVERNVFLSYSQTISVSTATPLVAGASIGVTKPYGAVTIGTYTADYSSYFFSDNSLYMLQDGTDHTLRLVSPPPVPPVVIGTLSIPDSFTAGHNLGLSDLTSYVPTVTITGTTVIDEGWQSCVDSGSWTGWMAGGALPLDTASTYKQRYYVTYSGGIVYSNEVTLTVVGNTTALALTATPLDEQVVGSSVTLTATLSGFFAGAGVNGQAVIFKNGETTLGTANMNSSGVATYTWTPSEGTYSLTAVYAATAYNTAATSSTVSYNVTVSPGIAAVAAAKTAAQNVSYTNMTQTSATDENAINTALKNTADTAVNNSNITTTINKVSYTAPTAGTSANPSGINGSYIFTVTVSKGSQSETTEQKTISITATPLTSVTDAQAVATAKTAAQSASYTNMTQTSATDENAINTALKNTVETAVNNSNITTTINKVSYTAPTAGTSANPSGTNGSYIFTVTVSKGSQSETTEQKTISITATPYTEGTGGSSGGSSGGGSDGSSGGGCGIGSNTPAPSTKPTESVTGSTENKAMVDNKGNASVSLTDNNIIDAITDAKAEAEKKGVDAGEITAVIHVTTDGKDANTLTVNLPKTTQEQVIGNMITSVELVIDRPDLTIGIDLAAVTEINRQAKADVQLSATRVDNSKLSGDARAAIGNRPTYDLKAIYGSGKSVTNFGKGSVSVEIPYTLQKGEIAGNVYAVYVDKKGKLTYLTASSYDAKRQTVVFSTSHLSTYGIAYKASFKFTDINSHWAKDDILFVANRGLMTGTSATTFSPGGSMTRGMFVTALGRLANADISSYKQSSFTDVKADDYYMGYIEWSVKNNILDGIGGGKFDPDGLVTREQMAVIMDRYATAIGFKLPEVHAQNVFADNAQIGAWAVPSIKRIQMAGILQGKNNNLIDPQGTATRAEVSAVLRRFVELTIFNNTAQGWEKNDSGQWMFFENGKASTGWKDMKSKESTKRYYFNTYGIMIAGKWLQIDGKWYYFYANGSLAKSTKIGSYEVDENGVRRTM